MKTWKKIGWQLFLVLTLVSLLAGQARGQYTFTTIDDPLATNTLNNGTTVTGIWSNIVVGYYHDPDLHGFYHQLGTTNYIIVDEPLGFTNNSSSTQVNGISGNNLVGNYQDGSSNPSGFLGFVYNMATSNFTTLVDTNSVSEEVSKTYGTGIDGSNIVGEDTEVAVGPPYTTYDQGILTTTSSAAYNSFYYPSPSQVQPDGLSTNYTYATRALGISGSNVVGFWQDTDSVTHGFIYNTGTATFSNIFSPIGAGCKVTCIDGGNVAGSYGDPNFSYNSSGFIFNTATSNYISSIRDPLATQDTYVMGIYGTTVVGYYVDNNGVNHGFVAVPTVIAPQMEVFSGSNQVTNNQTSAVNVGSVVQGQIGPIANFTVTNAGSATLYLTNISAPSGFSVIPGFPTNIAAAGSGVFSVQLDSNTVGNFSGNVVITNGDPNNNPFTFAITGSVSNAPVSAPEIEVFDGEAQIANNQLTAVNFGSVLAGQTGPTVNFTVTDAGNAILYLTNISAPAGFSVVPGYPTSILVTGSGMFSVQLNSAGAGNFSGNVVITNGDPDNNPFTFAIKGAVTNLPSELLSLIASPSQGGFVSAGGTNGGGFFPLNSQQTVTATANTGYEFTGWSGDASGSANPLEVTVTSPLVITANFTATNTSTNLTITVITNGGGKVLPNLNGLNLVKNHNYTIKATASNGYIFSNWTGTIVTNKNPLTIKAESNVVLYANFVINPFATTKGVYNGLFSMSNGVTEETAGMLKGLTVNDLGHYSGTLLINGASHGITGTFDLGGLATNKITRPVSQGGPLLLEMTLSNPGSSAPEVTGSVAGTNNGVPWVATNLVAYYATNTLPADEYAMLIPPDVNNTPPNGSPGGDGYALITNNPSVNHPASATAKITGALADGTAFNQTVPVSQGGLVPVYANLYGGKGLLLGWINLDLANTVATAETSLTWIHPAKPSGLYRLGFTNLVLTNQILLSRWTNPPGSFAGLNLSLLGTINDEASITNNSVSVNSAGKITGTGVSGSINLKTGLVTVTVGTGANKVTGHGVMLNSVNGGGYYLTKTNTAQAILLGL